MGAIPLPAALSGNVQERIIRLDSALLYLVNGTLAYLNDKASFEQTGTLTVDEADEALNESFWIYLTEEASMANPVQASLWHDESRVVTGNAKLLATNTAQMYGYAYVQYPGIVGQITKQEFVLAAGEYDLYILGTKGNVHGIHDAIVNGSVVGSFDQYNGIDLFNQIWTFPVTIDEPGLHTIEFETTGKNASSSTYLCPLTKYWLIPA